MFLLSTHLLLFLISTSHFRNILNKLLNKNKVYILKRVLTRFIFLLFSELLLKPTYHQRRKMLLKGFLNPKYIRSDTVSFEEYLYSMHIAAQTYKIIRQFYFS